MGYHSSSLRVAIIKKMENAKCRQVTELSHTSGEYKYVKQLQKPATSTEDEHILHYDPAIALSCLHPGYSGRVFTRDKCKNVTAVLLVTVKKLVTETSLVVRWLRLQAPNAGGSERSSVSCQGTRSHEPKLKSPPPATKTQSSQKRRILNIIKTLLYQLCEAICRRDQHHYQLLCS